MKNYYSVLGIRYPSSEEEIKEAYRLLAQKYHPEPNRGELWAESKFKGVQEAYAVLSDSNKKQEYDQEYKRHFLKRASTTGASFRKWADVCHTEQKASDAKKNLGNPRNNPRKAEEFYRWMNFDKHAKTSIYDGLKPHEIGADTDSIGCGGLCSGAFMLVLFTSLFFCFLFVAFPTKKFWNRLVAPDAEVSTSQTIHEQYWVTSSSGKTHNASCRYYANSNGYYSAKGTGNNCKVCGGAN